jgi:hypothetical protein
MLKTGMSTSRELCGEVSGTATFAGSTAAEIEMTTGPGTA